MDNVSLLPEMAHERLEVESVMRGRGALSGRQA